MTRFMKARAIFWRLMALICVLRAVWDVIEGRWGFAAIDMLFAGVASSMPMQVKNDG